MTVPPVHIKRDHPDLLVQRAALALITVGEEENRRYLLQWNDKWQCYNLIGGKMDNAAGDANCFVRTIRREIEEELGIGSLDNLLAVHEIRQVRMEQYSLREQRRKAYHFALFEISFFPNLLIDRQKVNRALEWLTSRHQNAYASEEEIMNLRTSTDKPISTTTREILQALGKLSMIPDAS